MNTRHLKIKKLKSKRRRRCKWAEAISAANGARFPGGHMEKPVQSPTKKISPDPHKAPPIQRDAISPLKKICKALF
jgi:hypothetical protein